MKRGIISLLACMFALSLALVGCSGGGSASGSAGASSSGSDPKAVWVGTWDLIEMDQQGQVVNAEGLQRMKDLGVEVYVELNEDGSGAFVLFGEAMGGTWEAKSETEAVLTIQDQGVNMVIGDGGNMTIEEDDTKLVFVKGESHSAATTASSASAAANTGSASGSASAPASASAASAASAASSSSSAS